MPPLTPLPPTSTPNPRSGRRCSRRCWGVGHERSSARGQQVRREPHTSASPCAMCCDGTVTDDSDPGSLRAVAELLATEAADFVRRRRTEVFGADSAPEQSPSAVRTKSTPTDPVTVVDTETERLLRDRLAELRPGEPIVGEEEGGSALGAPGQADRGCSIRSTARSTSSTASRPTRCRWGCRSTAVGGGCSRERPDRRGVLSCTRPGRSPAARRRVDAVALQPHRRRVDGVGRHGLRLFPRAKRPKQADVLARLLPDVRDVRRIGSCALDLCMVAAGRLDAYYELGVQRVGLGGGRADRRGGRGGRCCCRPSSAARG